MELPDSLFRRVKTSASSRGRTMKEFITEALISALSIETSRAGQESGWRAVYGKASRKDIQAVDRAIKGEFERINPEDWK